MKRKLLAPCIGIALSSMAFGNYAHAEQLVWIQNDLYNLPIDTYFGGGKRSSTNTSFESDNLSLRNDAYPVSHINTRPTDSDYLNAEVGFTQESANSIAITTKADVSWTAPLTYGAWANANAYLYSAFRIDPDIGDPETVEKNIIVLTQGNVNNFNATIDDGTTTTNLVEGENKLTLKLGQGYTIDAHLYSFSEATSNDAGAGKKSSSAKMKIIIGDATTTCDLTVTPTYNAGKFTVDTDLLAYEPSNLSMWITDGPRQVLNKNISPDTKVQSGIFSFNQPKAGTVGLLSVLTSGNKGITCSNWTTVDTGAP